MQISSSLPRKILDVPFWWLADVPFWWLAKVPKNACQMVIPTNKGDNNEMKQKEDVKNTHLQHNQNKTSSLGGSLFFFGLPQENTTLKTLRGSPKNKTKQLSPGDGQGRHWRNIPQPWVLGCPVGKEVDGSIGDRINGILVVSPTC